MSEFDELIKESRAVMEERKAILLGKYADEQIAKMEAYIEEARKENAKSEEDKDKERMHRLVRESGLTKEKVTAMSYNELCQLKRDNPELYDFFFTNYEEPIPRTREELFSLSYEEILNFKHKYPDLYDGWTKNYKTGGTV